MAAGKWDHLFGGANWYRDGDGVLWYGRPCGQHDRANADAFVYFAKQELLRLIVDVQQNRNRPE